MNVVIAIVLALAAPRGVLPQWGGELDLAARQIGDAIAVPPAHEAPRAPAPPWPYGPWAVFAAVALFCAVRMLRARRRLGTSTAQVLADGRAPDAARYAPAGDATSRLRAELARGR